MKGKPQIFFIHFAGGNCYSFQSIVSLLNDFKVETLELPGRGKRLGEKLITDFSLAAEDIYNQIVNRLTSDNFLIFGHSMGAYLSLKITNMLGQIDCLPNHLIVGGNAGPGIGRNKRRYLMGQGEFIDELRILGGVPEEFFENEELYNFFEPILRADFRVAEEHGLDRSIKVDVPIYAMMGSEEEDVNEISNWSNFTNKDFNSKVFKGGHFFIHNHSNGIATVIDNCYSSTTKSSLLKSTGEEI